MHYSAYHSVDVINGEGTRCTLFVSGCEHGCKGCYNQSTWRVDAGHIFSQALEDQIIDDLTDTRIYRRGLSLSGGDPLHPANFEGVLKLVTRVKLECPDKDIWLWTGYQRAELTPQQQAVVNFVDVLIDGKYEQDKADPALLWRGSMNQQIHRFMR
ncbi:anaerobic ribonucleoside-triphosphate reductase-activating protein [Shewanella sp. Arc9-LZ]|jgi:anaerobic ribonucleoside-triphosphate reductase activating protein|uniref:anaerobic ribonucleoside-triphosphate reductase-activating protein n=1 Tax=Shewanella sp. Arc9-LZ TaxID=2698686 RepID=UPI00137BAF32|nr:anaerobic ribonucleoside-triphosphate reductase-activating protein [Shewanella sp. Arc9-LZ]QHS13037.1 anaerobic ribonucleoside-triphosphate reductase-activating protein [Shewanella sp. Arc9-LZ]